MKQETSHGGEPASRPPFAAPSSPGTDNATLQLLQYWRTQDATDNMDEVRAAEQELAEFNKAMNENRALAGEPLLFP